MNDSSIMHGESVLHELSIIDPKYRDNRTVIGHMPMMHAPSAADREGGDNDFAFG